MLHGKMVNINDMKFCYKCFIAELLTNIKYKLKYRSGNGFYILKWVLKCFKQSLLSMFSCYITFLLEKLVKHLN